LTNIIFFAKISNRFRPIIRRKGADFDNLIALKIRRKSELGNTKIRDVLLAIKPLKTSKLRRLAGQRQQGAVIMATEQTDSGNFLNSMLQNLDTASQKLEQRPAATNLGFDINALLGDMRQGLETAVKDKRPIFSLDIKSRLQTADWEQVRVNLVKEKMDLAGMMANLNIVLEGLGAEVIQLKEMTPKEKVSLEQAGERIKEAELALAKAETKRLFRKSATLKAQAGLASAKQLEVATKERINRAMRDRINNATIEDSLTAYKLACDRLLKAMQARAQSQKKQLEQDKSQKRLAFETHAQATEACEKIEQQINALKGELAEAEQTLITMDKSDKGFAKQDQKTSDLKQTLNALQGKYNICMAIAQEAQNFAHQLDLHVQTINDLLTINLTWQAMITKQVEYRQTTVRSWLEATKSHQDLASAEELNRAGRGVDARSMASMAEIRAAAQKALVKALQEIPEWLRLYHEIMAASNQQDRQFRGDVEEQIKLFQKNYGFDLKKESFFGDNEK
jgi:hypothetical protein